MAAEKPDVLLLGPPRPVFVNGLAAAFTVHRLPEPDGRDALAAIAPRLRAIAVSSVVDRVDADLMARLPRLAIVSTFGVGYDHIDAHYAGTHGIVVTNTPDVLTEEVADTALGLLLCTAREFVEAERFVRAGRWLERGYPLSKASLRNCTVGLVGMGRIGKAIARRLDAMAVPVVYHTRRPAADVAHRHYPSLIDMARAVDVLLVIVPGGAETK
ncbi:MAG TPA: NAD(P)-dependent oxidoreductase, partial [Xanthobacteraceae bacterium]